MSNTVNVFWGDVFVGACFWDEKKNLAFFEYDPKFIKTGIELSPLKMPLSRTIYAFPENNPITFHRLPGLLADSLPDRFGQGLIERWRLATGRSQLNPVEKLSYIGNRGMGALEYKPMIGSKKKLSEKIEIQALSDLVDEIIQKRSQIQENLSKDQKKALEKMIQIGSSAGGARAKALIAWNPKTKEMRSGQVEAPEGFSHWLLKFDSKETTSLGDPQGYGRVEYIYNLMAQECGIEIPEIYLLEEEFSSRAHFMSQRFDRKKGRKIHTQTLCAIAHYDYNKQQTYSYENLMNTCRQLKIDHQSIEQVFRRMVFNVVARNQDDHTRNFAFTMNAKGEWSLSPAYDICWSYNQQWVSQHQLTMNGKADGFVLDDFKKIAYDFHIPSWKSTVAKTLDVISSWNTRSEQYKVPSDLAQTIQKTHRLNFKL